MNLRTGKQYLSPGYAPSTINHALSVVAAFYEFHAGTGKGPVVSPVCRRSRHGRRLNEHHNPLEPCTVHRRGTYRQKQPDREPRTLPDDVLDELFGELACHRDRALSGYSCPAGHAPVSYWA